MRKLLRQFLWLILALCLLAACAPSAPAATNASSPDNAAVPTIDAAAAEPRRILRMPHELSWGGMESLDPASPVAFFYVTVILYDRLTHQDDSGEAVPSLATAWSANPDATEWTFALREGVTFHNGQPFTSADVAYTFARIVDPAVASPATVIADLITSTETPDVHTIVFHLAKPHTAFPLLLSSFWLGIIPVDSGATIGESGVGTGPFQLEKLDVLGTTVLRANNDYWKGRPGMAGIELPGIADAGARILALQSGQVDLLLDGTATQAELFVGNPDFNVVRYQSNRFSSFVMRTDVAPFDDVRVRQAMRLVADRQAMVDLVLNGAGIVNCDTAVGPTDPNYWSSECPQDIEKAKALLAEAGYPDGLDVTLYTSDATAELIPLAEIYKQQAAAAGIRVALEVRPAEGFWNEVWMKEPFFMSYIPDQTADELLNGVWRSGASWNESFFHNATFDQLLDEARASSDPVQQRTLYQQAQQLISQEGGHLIPYHIEQFSLASASLSNVPQRDIADVEWQTITRSN